jgi:hypothetical protein
VQGILIPTGTPLSFTDTSVFTMQPLQTEEFHEIDITF